MSGLLSSVNNFTLWPQSDSGRSQFLIQSCTHSAPSLHPTFVKIHGFLLRSKMLQYGLGNYEQPCVSGSVLFSHDKIEDHIFQPGILSFTSEQVSQYRQAPSPTPFGVFQSSVTVPLGQVFQAHGEFVCLVAQDLHLHFQHWLPTPFGGFQSSVAVPLGWVF